MALPGPAGGAYSAPPDSLLGFLGQGRGGRKGERERDGEGGGRGVMGKEEKALGMTGAYVCVLCGSKCKWIYIALVRAHRYALCIT